jgi:hypothetical protein
MSESTWHCSAQRLPRFTPADALMAGLVSVALILPRNFTFTSKAVEAAVFSRCAVLWSSDFPPALSLRAAIRLLWVIYSFLFFSRETRQFVSSLIALAGDLLYVYALKRLDKAQGFEKEAFDCFVFDFVDAVHLAAQEFAVRKNIYLSGS